MVRLTADFQDPVDMIPKFVREWEQGTKIVIGVKVPARSVKVCIGSVPAITR